MAVIANRRSVMTLFSDASCPQSHRVRIVLAEKGITVEIANVDPDNLPEDLIDLNPYQSVPTLIDLELLDTAGASAGRLPVRITDFAARVSRRRPGRLPG